MPKQKGRAIKHGTWKAAEQRASMEGGFGVVRFGIYKGRWAVAKTVKRASAAVNELQVLQHVGKNNHIVELLDWVCDEPCDGAVLFLEAGCIDLFDYVARWPLAHDAVRHVFSQLASGVSHLVSCKVAHLDIKLENVVVKHAYGDKLRVKLIDFGLSHVYTSEPARSLIHMRGSHFFAAPEVQTASKDMPYSGFAADIWSLGICLYALQFKSFAWDRAVADDRNFRRLMLDDRYKDIMSALRAVNGDTFVDRSDSRAHAVLNGALTLLHDDDTLCRRWDIFDILANDYVCRCPP